MIPVGDTLARRQATGWVGFRDPPCQLVQQLVPLWLQFDLINSNCCNLPAAEPDGPAQ